MPELPEQNRIAQAIFEAACRRRQVEKPRIYLGMSQIGDPCGRKLWYDFRGLTARPMEGRVLRIFEAGNDCEKRVIRDLREAGFRVDDQQLTFSDVHGFFSGHCDGVIHGVTQRPHILEVKSANKNKFDAFRRVGVRQTYPVYYSQCQCYMGYAGLERALVVVDCKDNSDVYTERINFNPADFEALRRRAWSIITADNPEDRPYAQNSQECRWCDYSGWCWSPGDQFQTTRSCKNCYYCVWKDRGFACHSPQHPFEILRWDVSCPDYQFFFGDPWTIEAGSGGARIPLTKAA